jgi:uncharacterized protein YciI
MWFLCQRHAAMPRDQWKVTLDQHLVWMKRMHEEGKIVISGPTPDKKVGMYLIHAPSREEAERIAAGDPFTAAGQTRFELLEWEIHQIMGMGPFTAAGLGHPAK